MRETITTFEVTVTGADAVEYTVRAIGKERADGIWEGHIAFDSGSGDRLVTGLETTQPNGTALQHWAAGLERVYLETALRRARNRRIARANRPARAERRA
jgi:hypothetical protein